MAEIDWSALRTPDYATNALKATTLGREDGLALAKQNALKTYASDPDAGIQQLMAVDPQSAVTLQKAQAEQRQQASQVQAGQAAASGDLEGAARIAGGAGNFDLMAQIQGMSKEQRAVASQAYGELASTAYSVKNLPYEQRKAALAAQSPRLQQLGVKPEQIANFDPTDQNIDSFVQTQLGVKGQIDQSNKDREYGLQRDQYGEVVRHNQVDETHATAQLAETTRHDKTDEGLTGQKNKLEAQQLAAAGWQTMVDPANGDTPYRYNARTGQATTLDGSQPYAPKGILKVGSDRQGITGPAIALKRYLEQNPSATSDDISAFNAKLKSQAKATSDFATGPQGKTLNSINVAVDHINTVRELMQAMGNGDIQTLNRVKQRFETEFGQPAPTNLAAARQLVGGEIAKVVAAGGSTMHDRQEAEAAMSGASSPAQFAGTLGTVQKLMAGQVRGLRLQYKNTTGLDDFEAKLLPGTRAALESIDNAQPAGGASDAAIAKARAAIKAGADRNAVIQRLQQSGINPAGL